MSSVQRHDLATYADWGVATLVATVLAVDGFLGLGASTFLFDRGIAPTSGVPVDYQVVRAALTAIALVTLAVLGVAAGIRSRPAGVAVTLAGLPVVFAYAVTGALLPWDQLSYWVGSRLLGLVVAVPVAGEFVARLVFGGVTLGRSTLVRAFVVHYAIVALAGAGLLAWIARRGWDHRDRFDVTS